MRTAILEKNQNLSHTTDAIEEDQFFAANAQQIGEEVPMNIAEDGIGFILDLLTDLSVNRGAYALREAYSNAYDATMATGDMSRPIEIELPKHQEQETPLSQALSVNTTQTIPQLVVRDHGIGMSYDDVRRYFTQYGGSKKRATGNKTAIGSKGLGSKAPLACSDTFTVVSVKDGIKTTAVIERRDNQNFATLMSENTDQSSGTEIIVPICDDAVISQMNKCANDIENWNLDATLIIDGVKIDPMMFSEEGLKQYVYLGYVKVGEDAEGNDVKFRMWQFQHNFPLAKANGFKLVLGGYPYNVTSHRSGYTSDLIVAGDPGYLNFTPSRDEIKDDAAKKRFMEAVSTAVESTYDPSLEVSNIVKNCNSYYELCTWMGTRRYQISDCGEKCSLVSRSLGYRSVTIPKSAFIKDNGADLRECFAVDNLDESKIRNFRYLLFSASRNRLVNFQYFSSRSCSRDGDSIRKSDLLDKRYQEMIPLSQCANMILKSTAKRSFFTVGLQKAVISGMNKQEKWELFSKNEKTIREFLFPDGNFDSSYFLTSDDIKEFTPTEQLIVEDRDMRFYDIEDLVQKATCHRRAQQKKKRLNDDDRPKSATVIDTISFQMINLEGIAEKIKAGKGNIVHAGNLNIEISKEGLKENEDVLFTIINDQVEENVSAYITALLQAEGVIDTKYKKIALCDSSEIKAPMIKKMSKLGFPFLLDDRERVQNHVPTLFDDLKDLVYLRKYRWHDSNYLVRLKNLKDYKKIISPELALVAALKKKGAWTSAIANVFALIKIIGIENAKKNPVLSAFTELAEFVEFEINIDLNCYLLDLIDETGTDIEKTAKSMLNETSKVSAFLYSCGFPTLYPSTKNENFVEIVREGMTKKVEEKLN